MTVVGWKRPVEGFGKSLIGLVLGALVPLLIFGAITASVVVSQKETALANDLASTAAGLSVAVDLELLNQFKTMDMLASSALIQENDLHRFNDLARRALQTNNEWRNIGLIEPGTARIIAGAPAVPSTSTYSLSPRHVAEVVATRKPVIVGTFPQGKLSEGPVVLLMTPVVRANRVQYVLGVAMNPQALSDIFAAQGMAAHWTGATVDNAMVLSGRSREAEKFVGTLATPSLQAQIRASTTGLFTATTKDGSTVYTVFRRSERTGWSVVIGVPMAELDAPLHHLLMQLVSAGLALILLALTAALYVGRGIVTARNSYEQALQKGQQDLQEALNRLTKISANLPGVVFQFRRRPDGSYALPYASDAIQDLHNATVEEVRDSANKVFDVVHPDDLPTLLQSIEHSAFDLSPWKQEYRVQCTNSNVRWLFGNALPQLEADGSVLWHGFITDISAHKAMEADARQNEMKFQTILESAPDAIFITDPSGNYRYVNTAASRLLGYPREALVQKHIVDITPSDEIAMAKQLLEQLHAGEIVRAEFNLVRCDQSLVPVAFYGVELPNGQLYGSCRDISDRIKAQQELQRSRQELEDLYENAPCGYHSVDKDGKFLRINRTELSWLGYTRDEVIGTLGLKDVLTESSQRVMQTQFPQFLKTGILNDMELSFQRKNGTVFHGLVNATALIDANGEMHSSRSTTFDLTDRFQAEEHIRMAEERFRLFFEKNSSVMLLIDPARGLILNANQAAANFYGYPLNALLGMPVAVINTLPPEHIEAEIQKAKTEFRKFFVFQHRLASAETRDVEVYATPIDTADGTLLLSIVHDITDRTESEKKVHQLAFYDSLTLLPNRRLLSDRLNQAMNASKRNQRHCALMFIDLDNFKPINDQHGHSVGDLLLVEVARRVKGCIREIDTVARFGGDEFVVLLSKLDEDRNTAIKMATQVAEKIRLALAQTYAVQVAGQTPPAEVIHHNCTASIGVTVFRGNDHSQDELQKQADAAMYHAKGLGRNQIYLSLA